MLQKKTTLLYTLTFVCGQVEEGTKKYNSQLHLNNNFILLFCFILIYLFKYKVKHNKVILMHCQCL